MTPKAAAQKVGSVIRWGLFLTGAGLVISNYVLAAGKKPPQGCGTDGGGITTPMPIRAVVVGDVGTKAFKLPNGAQVNLNADLSSILNTVITESGGFVASDPASITPCSSYLQLRAAVTTLEMDSTDVQVKFGYTPGGALSTVTNLTGTVGVKLGSASMDFQVWQCNAGQPCQSVVAAYANQAVLGADVAFSVDFGQITTGASLVFNTDLGKKLRAVMQDGLKKLATHPNVNQLYWQARVIDYNSSSGVVTIDAGSHSGIAVNQSFTIYARTNAESACPVTKAIAYIHTTGVDNVSSRAQVDAVVDDTAGIVPGDTVMIRAIQQ